MDKIAIIGNLYSVLGIGILVRNYLASPNLRFLIVWVIIRVCPN